MGKTLNVQRRNQLRQVQNNSTGSGAPGPGMSAPSFSLADRNTLSELYARKIKYETLSVAPGQQVFSLAQEPDGAVLLHCNGHCQNAELDFVLDGRTLTWISSCFDLAPTDTIQVMYLA